MAMTNGLTLETLLGEETWHDATYKLQLFCSSPPATIPGWREAHVGTIAKDSRFEEVLTRPVHRSTQMSGRDRLGGVRREELGKWTDAMYMVAPGTILKLYASYHSGEWGRAKYTVQKYLVMDQYAPVNRLEMTLKGSTEAALTHAHISGRFHLLSMEEARARGVPVNMLQKHFFDKDNFDRVIRKIELEAGIQPPEVSTQTVKVGERTVEVTRVRSRRQFD